MGCRRWVAAKISPDAAYEEFEKEYNPNVFIAWMKKACSTPGLAQNRLLAWAKDHVPKEWKDATARSIHEKITQKDFPSNLLRNYLIDNEVLSSHY